MHLDACCSLKDDQAALVTLEELVDVYGEGEAGDVTLAEYLLNYSILLERADRPQESVEAYNRCVKLLN